MKDPYFKTEGLLTFDPKDGMIFKSGICSKGAKLVGAPKYPAFSEQKSYTRTINKIAIILNPHGGRGQASRVKDLIVPFLQKKNIVSEVRQIYNFISLSRK